MKCDEVRLLLSEYCKGELSAKRTEETRAHIEGCEGCAAEEASERSLVGFLKANPPELPKSMAFSMMQNRVWEELAARRQKRRLWFGLFGFIATAALVALVFLWPGARSSVNKGLLPPSLQPDEIAAVEAALEQEEGPLEKIFSPVDVSDLDDETAARLSEEISRAMPEPEYLPEEAPLPEDGGYLDEMEGLTPEELDRLDTLLKAKKG